MSKLFEDLRGNLLGNAKTFKTSWIFLGQALYTVWRDKTFHEWGHEKFEDYVVNELGMEKRLAMKLVKTYFFVEQEEPGYLKEEFKEGREAAVIPSYEPLDALRMAKRTKEITQEDYQKLREAVFVKGKDAAEVRKELTAMIKERKQIDPDTERENRNQASIKKIMGALKSFIAEGDILELIEYQILEDAKDLFDKLENRYA